jgi:hypothetical protein
MIEFQNSKNLKISNFCKSAHFESWKFSNLKMKKGTEKKRNVNKKE